MTENNNLENSTASASLVGRLDIPDLMASDWSFFDTTPAGGVAYYNEKEDRTAIKYPNSIKLYYHRVPGTHDKWAINFMNCKVFEVQRELSCAAAAFAGEIGACRRRLGRLVMF